MKKMNAFWEILPLFVTYFMSTQTNIIEGHIATGCTKGKHVTVNVIVHGVCNIGDHIGTLSGVINFFRDEIYNTYYHCNLTLFRKEPTFYQFQAMQDLGLHPITDTTPKPGNSCAALITVINRTFDLFKYQNLPEQRYYTYGWSGLHSVKEYRAVGKMLLEDLRDLKQQLSGDGYEVTLRVWGYSHGGNVALMMGHHSNKVDHQLIDELVILGTPFISGETVDLINSPLFKKIYNVYSLSDKVQSHDLIHLNAFWCEQKLTTKSIKKLPEHLIQVRLKYTVASNHAKKSIKSFAHSLNFDKKSILLGRSPLLRNMSPGHLELWLFGWTFDHYRPHFITYPIPAGALSIPYALHYLDDIIATQGHNPEEEFIIDVRPDHELVLINKKYKKKGTINKVIVPFFEKNTFEKLKQEILKYNPLDLTYEAYRQKVTEIDKQAWLVFGNQTTLI